MKRIALVLVAAMLLVLGVYWKAGPPQNTREEETTALTSTEVEATTEPLPAVTILDETDRVKVRLLSLDAEENQEQRKRVENYETRDRTRYFDARTWRMIETTNTKAWRMSDTKTLFWHAMKEISCCEVVNREIILRDERTGKETMLIRGNGGTGVEWGSPQPYVSSVIDDRYFAYEIRAQGGVIQAGIYDTKEMVRHIIKNIYIESVYNGSLYYLNWGNNYSNTFCFWKVDIASFLKDGDPKPVNLLDGTDFRVDLLYGSAFSPNEKYLVLRGYSELCIIDVEKREEIYRANEYARWWDMEIWFEDANTLYGFESGYKYGIFEIVIK